MNVVFQSAREGMIMISGKSSAGGHEALPNRVYEFREDLGMSKVELARLAKLSDKTIARVERGERGFRSITYRRILNALNRERRRQDKPELSFDGVFPSQVSDPN